VILHFSALFKKTCDAILLAGVKEKNRSGRNSAPARKVLLSNIQVLKKKKHK
jgi:hypothetical protein